ncbi:MAG TPA: cupredoxin domain-containing protein [Dehalococcoidia bacterium]|nr:cupredoxin domain-containing protein [Dehalococcoidia bacterium]
MARKSMTIWQRIAGFHFPAWAPVVFIIAIVFGILGFLFYYRSAAGAPRIGDHWHAPYAIFIGDELQPRIQEVVTSEGVHTHGDSVVHLHPHVQVAEGSGAGLEHFFGDMGGKLSNSEMRIPGRDKVYKNGDTLEGDDRPSELRILKADSGFHPLGGDFNRAIVACNARAESEFERVSPRYVPKDGDCIRIIFGPPDVPVVVQQDRTIIDPSTADRDIQMEVTGNAAETVFTPASLDVQAGETVKVVLKNNSQVIQEGDKTIAPFHGLRFSGADREYGTSDDYVLSNIDPGVEGSVAIKYDIPGEYEFRDEQAVEGVAPVTGKVIVGEAAATPAPGATPTPVPADLSLEVTATDAAFDPAALTVEAGKTFRLKLSNTGTLIHNLRIAGPDGQFDTTDDLVTSTFVNPGGTGEIVGKIDSAGTYPIRDDYHKTTLTGTLTVQ